MGLDGMIAAKTPAGVDALPWYAAQTKPQGEALAEQHLRRQGYRVFSPWYPVEEVRDGRYRYGRRHVFRGYVFAGLSMPGQPIAPIESTTGISGLVTVSGEPVPIPARVMDEMRRLLAPGELDQMIRLAAPDEGHRDLEVGRTYRLDGERVRELPGAVAAALADRLAKVADQVDSSGKVRLIIGQVMWRLPAELVGEAVPAEQRP